MLTNAECYVCVSLAGRLAQRLYGGQTEVHEAGHVVAAFLLGLEALSVSVEPDRESLGRMVFALHPPKPGDDTSSSSRRNPQQPIVRDTRWALIYLFACSNRDLNWKEARKALRVLSHQTEAILRMRMSRHLIFAVVARLGTKKNIEHVELRPLLYDSLRHYFDGSGPSQRLLDEGGSIAAAEKCEGLKTMQQTMQRVVMHTGDAA